MSLYSKLGPQGKSLLAQGGGTVEFGDGNEPPQELDFLINELRNPGHEITTDKIFGYLYHYLPQIKVEHNLQLVVASFLNNPVCFKPGGINFEENYLIIEVFKALCSKKLTISYPSISIKAWYKIILQELTNFVHFDLINNCWKILPIISGLQLANQLRDDLYTHQNVIEYKWFFNNWDNQMKDLYKTCLNYTLTGYHSDNIINLSLLSYAITFNKSHESVKDYTPKLSNGFIINKLIQLLFSNHHQGCQIYQQFFLNDKDHDEIIKHPVIKHLNRLCFLLENYFSVLPMEVKSFDLIIDSIIKIKQFNQLLSKSVQLSIFNHKSSLTNQSPLHQNFWYLMKSIFFGECIIFQGILTRFLQRNNRSWLRFGLFKSYNLDVEYRQISFKILECLYSLNHILLSIGQGGFDSYNFIYYLSLEIILSNNLSIKELEKFSMILIGYPNVNLYFESLNHDLINRSKVLFVFGLWENYLQHNKQKPFANEIFKLCFDMVNNSNINEYELMEAGHSVLLLCFSNNKSSLSESMDYVSLLLDQFPTLLSPHQLSIAIETIGKSILSQPLTYSDDNQSMFRNSTEEFLEFFYSKCFNIPSGVAINPQSKNFTSAQPIGEIGAESTIRSLESKKESIDIIKQNKINKPKDIFKLDIVPDQPNAYQFAKRIIPDTLREGIILSFINLVPYLPLSIFIEWLDKIMILIDSSNKQESSYLLDMLWKVISENLDLNRCELAYRWWYETKQAVALEFKSNSSVKL